jgi:isopentenyl diphosphate isomerase/L-lactate dehydrogenase-like FMN-dependent dehydrogenase
VLALGGADAVARVLQILQDDLATAMALMGAATVDGLRPDRFRHSLAPFD